MRINNFEYNLLEPPVSFDAGGTRTKEVINFTIKPMGMDKNYGDSFIHNPRPQFDLKDAWDE